MKQENGYGNITKLSGKRRKPYVVRGGATYNIDLTTGKMIEKRPIIGTFATKREAAIKLAKYNENPYDLKVRYFSAGFKNYFVNLFLCTITINLLPWLVCGILPLYELRPHARAFTFTIFLPVLCLASHERTVSICTPSIRASK